jgi:hypothetical protein
MSHHLNSCGEPIKPCCNTHDDCLGCTHYHTTDCIKVNDDYECLEVEKGDLLSTVLEKLCEQSTQNCTLTWQDITVKSAYTVPAVFSTLTLQIPQFAKNECTNQVYLRGTFMIPQGNPDPNSASAFTLPSGFRPVTNRLFPNSLFPLDGFDTASQKYTLLLIKPNGQVIPSEIAGNSANRDLYYCLDGIVFETD